MVPGNAFPTHQQFRGAAEKKSILLKGLLLNSDLFICSPKRARESARERERESDGAWGRLSEESYKNARQMLSLLSSLLEEKTKEETKVYH